MSLLKSITGALGALLSPVKGVVSGMFKGLIGVTINPWILAVGAAVLLSGWAFGGVQTWRLHEAQLDVKTSAVETQGKSLDLSNARLNEGVLSAGLEHQNDEVAKISDNCKDRDQAPAKKALQVLATPARQFTGSGPPVMNPWLEGYEGRP